MVNNPEKAEYYFKEQVKWSEESMKLNRPYAVLYAAHYDLACVMALKGKTEKAI